jgi:hypothetical protein
VLSAIAGIVLVIVAVMLWVAKISPEHALAIFIGIIGVVILLAGVVPVRFIRR